jgi:hypothetical protein
MRPREDPRRWPICSALAVAILLAAVFLVPAAWIEALFSPLGSFADHGTESGVRPIVLLPVEIVAVKPEIEAVADEPEESERPIPLREDASWWQSVWRIHLQRQTTVALRGVHPDSGLALRLELLGGLTDLVRRVEPDSATADLLARLYLADGYRLQGSLKTFLSARGYALDHADLRSREAEMFDEHLFRSIPVTNSLADKLRDEESER